MSKVIFLSIVRGISCARTIARLVHGMMFLMTFFLIGNVFGSDNCNSNLLVYKKSMMVDVFKVTNEYSRFIVAPFVYKSSVKVFYPKGSYDPGSMKRLNLPVGGVSAKINFDKGFDCLFLTYDVKFDNGFDFVKGGKLPGLAGGTANTGGKIPNGYDGFSARFLWLGGGGGAVYAYLPTSKVWGTALGAYKWKYNPGQWHTLTQKIVLNDVGKNNGVLKVWFDKKLVHQEYDVLYRRSDKVKIDSFLFSSFFGGNKPEFAATADSYVYLRDIKISERL